jgi:hypothetical protein
VLTAHRLVSVEQQRNPGLGGAGHTLTVYRHFDHFDIAVLAKDFGDVSFRDIFGELFNHNL